MEYTAFLRRYFYLFCSNDLENTLLYYVCIALASVGIGNIFLSAFVEKDGEIALEAMKDCLSLIIGFSGLVEKRINLKNALRLVALIEEDLVVDKSEFWNEKEKLKNIESLQKGKEQRLRSKFLYLSWALSMIFLGYISKNVINYMLGIRDYLGNNVASRWPTPFIYLQPEFQSRSFVVYIYILQAYLLAGVCSSGFTLLTTITVSTEKVLADFEALYLLLRFLNDDYPDSSPNHILGNQGKKLLNTYQIIDNQVRYEKIRQDLYRVVKCHQSINRNVRVCTENTAFAVTAVIAAIVNDSCSNAFFMLKTNDVKKAVSFAFMFIVENITLFFVYQNGQRIFNQVAYNSSLYQQRKHPDQMGNDSRSNEILRKSLAEVPWTNKPRWFRQSLYIMMTRANVDTEMRPYGIFVLNYMSFKDIMKLAFSVGNVLYTKKLTTQTQHLIE